MDAGDYCQFWVAYAQDLNPAVFPANMVYNSPLLGLPLQYFKCIGSRVAVADDIPTSGTDRRTIRTRTEGLPVDWQRMKAYLANTIQRIRIQNQRIDRTGWNDTVKHYFISGKTDISILND
jgi:hypothetical protein